MSLACSQKTRSDIEWDRLLDAIASCCAGSLGADAARSLPFCQSIDDARGCIEEVREAHALLVSGEPLPGGGAPDVGPALDRVRAGGVLTPHELQSVGVLLGAARVLRRFLRAHKESSPKLWNACSTDPRLDQLAELIAQSFEPDGTLSDRASPTLQALRRERENTRERLLNKLRDIMQRYAPTLQDDYVTEREGRFVLPVRSDSHERFVGIVHATSGSGQTLFMEPRPLIPLGNKLKVLDADVQREEHAVCARLSGAIGEMLESVVAARRSLAHSELRLGCAHITERLALSFPSLVDQPVLDLVAARHPLLGLDGVDVVPVDVCVQPARALVISGPNAGGKTVVLKTLALTALMARAGLPLACRSGSTVGWFDAVVSEMGDEQSISKNLSTFSAHVRNLGIILDRAQRGVLVALDEIATGTDPREGQALAAAVLDSLCARGATIACTTHYEGLKTLALGDDRFVNASVGFDLSTMSPTFRLMMGVPGTSSAITIAARFGLPSLVVQRAEKLLGSDERNFEQLVHRLNDERRALELARAAIEREHKNLEEKGAELEKLLDAARSREKSRASQESAALLAAIRRARDELREAERRLRSKNLDERALRDASRRINRVAAKTAIGGELELPADAPAPIGATSVSSPTDLRAGMQVYLPRIRSEGHVLGVLPNGQVRVRVGAVKLHVPFHELQSLPRNPSASSVDQGVDSKPRPSPHVDIDHPIITSDARCDLRGLRVEDAVCMAEQFLDRCLNQHLPAALLIHGFGAGALRDAIRANLAHSPYVAAFRPGQPDEGGDGVTLVVLR